MTVLVSQKSEKQVNPSDPNDDPRFRITPIQQTVAACSGGLFTSLLLTPLDVVKVRLQAQQKDAQIVQKCFLYCNSFVDHICPCFTSNNTAPLNQLWHSKPSQFSGTLDAFRKIFRHEGITSLWSGLSPTLVLALPATVVYFVTYEQLRSRLKNVYHDHNSACSKYCDNTSFQPAWVPLVAGCTARTWSVMIVSPLELIRIKMQSERTSYFQVHEALTTLLRCRGFKGLWTGAVPTLLRDVPFSGIYWMTYEKIKSHTNLDGSSFFYSFLGGSLSGALAAVLTNPFDVVKTLYQIEKGEKQINSGRSTSILQTLKEIYSVKGLPGVFSGLLPRLIKVVPACAIMVATFEYGKHYFHRQNLNRHLQNSRDETVGNRIVN